MSKMSDLSIEIEERLSAGQSPEYIAGWLEIPIEWVRKVARDAASEEPDCYYQEANSRYR